MHSWGPHFRMRSTLTDTDTDDIDPLGRGRKSGASRMNVSGTGGGGGGQVGEVGRLMLSVMYRPLPFRDSCFCKPGSTPRGRICSHQWLPAALFLPLLLVSCGHRNKSWQTVGLPTIEMYFLMAWEARGLGSRCGRSLAPPAAFLSLAGRCTAGFSLFL